ncbi:T9SS type A sorting domain-containing protein [Dyadobacter fermentans]|nr:T9SS type A sorting domain-containing protein [Dyadobacter fermentans]
MRKIYIVLVLLFIVSGKAAWAQITTGNELFAKANTIISLDSLVLVPSVDVDLSNRSLTLAHTAVPGNPHASIGRQYLFDEPLLFSGDVGIIYRPSELNGNTESLLELSNSETNENGFVTFSGSSRDLAMHHVWKTVTGLNLKMLTLVNADAALPVALVAFHVRKEENGVEVAWETSFETNSDYFEIQRSGNAKDWQPIGRLSSAGESSQKTSYSYSDHAPMKGDNYYRLKMVDQDGTFAWSQIRKVTWDETALNIFPNPATDVLEMEAQDWLNVAQISVIDERGTVLKEQNPQTSSQRGSLSLEGLNAGSYILQARYFDGSVLRRHFIKH